MARDLGNATALLRCLLAVLENGLAEDGVVVDGGHDVSASAAILAPGAVAQGSGDLVVDFAHGLLVRKRNGDRD